MANSIDQLKTLTDGLNDYFQTLTTYFDAATNPCPSFEDFVAILEYDLILTDAVAGQDRAASYVTGALSDTVHQVLGILREFGIRTKLKSTYYADAEAETQITADFYRALYGRYQNFYKGVAPEQRRG